VVASTTSCNNGSNNGAAGSSLFASLQKILEIFSFLTKSSRVLKTHSESFDELSTNGDKFEMIDKIPFMLKFSKHRKFFSTTC
jgi:hypothetical protein